MVEEATQRYINSERIRLTIRKPIICKYLVDPNDIKVTTSKLQKVK